MSGLEVALASTLHTRQQLLLLCQIQEEKEGQR
jgi:hypothetical protein